jgi:hypothetical protein
VKKIIQKSYLVGNDLRANDIFNHFSSGNRDNCHAPYIRLREKFLQAAIELDTVDLAPAGGVPSFVLHQNVQSPSANGTPAYLMLWETSLIAPQNGVAENWTRYRKIFTWRDDLVDGQKFIKVQFPNPISVYPSDGFTDRPLLACVISGNKTITVADKRELYSERVRVIRWFERYAPTDFGLYGVDWDIPVVPTGLHGKLLRRFWRGLSHFIKINPFPSYRGKVQHKRDVLQHTRFSICYENVRDLPGYITEKIFDSFFSGCVPVYWGASNVTDYIPANCFVDRRLFPDTAAVYHHLKNMTEDEFFSYQQRISEFLQSNAAYQFSSEFLAETIVATIVQDLGTQS